MRETQGHLTLDGCRLARFSVSGPSVAVSCAKYGRCSFSLADLAGQLFLASGGVVLATVENSEAVIGPELDRSQAKSLVLDALTVVIPGKKVGAVDERQELYADLGMDSLRFAQLLVELEGRLNVELVDEDLMTIELVTVADLIDLVEHLAVG
jgi:acyl carrier protein